MRCAGGRMATLRPECSPIGRGCRPPGRPTAGIFRLSPRLAGPAAPWLRSGGDSGPYKKGPIRIAGAELGHGALANRRSAPRLRRDQGGRWWLPAHAAEIDNGKFYAQVKAPSRIHDLTSGDLKYRWTETGALDFYRYAHAFDHLYGAFRRRFGVVGYI